MSEEIKSHHLRALACDIEDCHNPQSWADYCRAAAARIEAQAAEITRLRAELATARREGMEGAARIADSCAADWSESAKGKYLETKWDYESRADAGEEIAAAIRAAAEEDRQP